jgi:hypothetical protein
MEKRDFGRARKHGYLLLEEIRQLHLIEPGNPEDTVVEAGAWYNMPSIEDQVGQTAEGSSAPARRWVSTPDSESSAVRPRSPWPPAWRP